MDFYLPDPRHTVLTPPPSQYAGKFPRRMLSFFGIEGRDLGHTVKYMYNINVIQPDRARLLFQVPSKRYIEKMHTQREKKKRKT